MPQAPHGGYHPSYFQPDDPNNAMYQEVLQKIHSGDPHHLQRRPTLEEHKAHLTAYEEAFGLVDAILVTHAVCLRALYLSDLMRMLVPLLRWMPIRLEAPLLCKP
jgi:hypothetical protein